MAKRETVFLGQPVAAGAGRLLASPFQFWVTGEENIRVQSVCSQSGVRLALHYRFLDPLGHIDASRQHHTPNSDRTMATSLHALGDGALLNLTIFAETGTPRIGECFVRVQLIRGLSGSTIVMGTIVQGYVTAQQDLAWPGSPIVSSVDAGGVIRMITGTDPAAGVRVSETVPTNARWELLTMRAVLATSAVAGVRRPFITFQVGAAGWFQSAHPGTVGPGSAAAFYWSVGVPLATVISSPGGQIAALPTFNPLLAGSTVVVDAENFDAGDNFLAPRMFVREWIEAA